MTAKMVSIINMKGGVGKTTLSINLAQYLCEIREKKVLLIDLDPQANATIVGISDIDYKNHLKNKKTVADLFINCFKSYGPFPHPKPVSAILNEYLFRSYESNNRSYYLDIIPSEINLSTVLKGVSVRPNDLSELIINKAKNLYDYIIIDCAPTYSILTTLALFSTKSVLIPVMADSFGIHGVDLMKYVLQEHKYDYGQNVKIVGLVFTMWRANRTHQIKFENTITKQWGLSTFKTKISNNDWYKIANGKRVSIWNTPAGLKYKKEFDNFVDEFIIKVQ